MLPIVEQQEHTSSQNQNKLSPLCIFLINPVQESFISCVSQKMNIHMNLNLNEMDNMIYQDPRRIKDEEDIVAAKTFSEEEDSSSCSLSSMCSSSDLTEEDDDDDASSSSSNGPLHDLSDLMSHLPIKRGLSKFYEGKSQSFTSLGNVKSLEDLMKSGFKNRKNYGARRKLCKSTGGIIDQSYKNVYSPKATISKKSTTRTPSSTLSCLSRRRH